ncbi:MAG: sulfur carrier protein ThiS [Lachnospiraceae bacterium]|nr:sulfur carrier protein ThiS [Robinsoniella sp.]MDY3765784.1 sulfur carrier protein ThiS [Lachnospiraceae bacterium]
MITVNGKEEYLEKSITLLEFLEQRQYRPERIAVEKNGEIIPKKMYAQTQVEQGDKLEVVSFVGGG